MFAADKVYGDFVAGFLFQLDFDPTHSAKTTTNCLADYDIFVLIENLRGTVKREMWNKQPNNRHKLKTATQAIP